MILKRDYSNDCACGRVIEEARCHWSTPDEHLHELGQPIDPPPLSVLYWHVGTRCEDLAAFGTHPSRTIEETHVKQEGLN